MLPVELLRLKLHDARCYGFSFDSAWPPAARQAAAIAASPRTWLEALEATRDSWRRAYEGAEVTAADAAMAVLAEGRELPEDDWGRRRCEGCGGWLAPDADPRALYCSVRCKRDASYVRERRAAVGPTPVLGGGK